MNRNEYYGTYYELPSSDKIDPELKGTCDVHLSAYITYYCGHETCNNKKRYYTNFDNCEDYLIEEEIDRIEDEIIQKEKYEKINGTYYCSYCAQFHKE